MTRVCDNWTAAVLDLFSAAAGGWSLGLHRAGFRTMAACEVIEWRRVLYSENNPGVKVYDDVRTLTASRLLDDFGYLPSVVVGSPPCQDISSANTKGKGVEGERSGLYFEAIRIIGEVRPRWYALENSANLRTRGADRVIAALADIGYTCWAFVVGADDVGANHERKRSWLIGCDLAQVGNSDSELSAPWLDSAAREGRDAFETRRLRPNAHDQRGGVFPRTDEAADADAIGRDEGWSRGRCRIDPSVSDDPIDAASLGHEGRRARGYRPDGDGAASVAAGDAADAGSPIANRRNALGRRLRRPEGVEGVGAMGCRASEARNTPDPDQARQAHGCMVPGLRQAEIADDGRGAGRRDDGSGDGQVAICAPDRRGSFGTRAGWSIDDLARHIRLDARLPAWVAGTRIAVGGPKGTSAASLIVEAFGDAVLPQIPEAIGRAILRTEAALSAVYDRSMAA